MPDHALASNLSDWVSGRSPGDVSHQRPHFTSDSGAVESSITSVHRGAERYDLVMRCEVPLLFAVARMQQKPHPLERAFQLAKNGSCRSMDELRFALKSEGYSTAHIVGRSITAQLKALMERLPLNDGTLAISRRRWR